MKLKVRELREFKQKLLEQQGWICPICKTDLKKQESKNVCADHCHISGLMRSVLCRNCNGIEAKIHNLLRRGRRTLTENEYFDNIVKYVSFWREEHQLCIYPMHPTHKTPEEKKALVKKRRQRKAKK